MIPLDEAQRIVLDACPPLAPVVVDLADAVGLVLAADVVADEQVPPFDNSAVDGYAVVAADVADAPVTLDIVGEVAAGAAPTVTLQRGQAIRIMTGAPVPQGADAVVMVEHAELVDDRTVRLDATASSGAAVRLAGSDVEVGDHVVPAGTVVSAAVLGTLASVNTRRVRAHPRPRVAVLATGDELVSDGGPLAPGQIRETNLRMLVVLLEQAGCDVTNVGVVADDEAVLETTLRAGASEHDVIVTSGGVSMGDYDVVKAVLGRIADMRWMQIAIKPAKPFAFGLLDGVPVFGLPGNPVSALVSFELLARPALRRMMGMQRLMRPSVIAISDDGVERRPDGKVHFQRVVGAFEDDGRYHVTNVGGQASHQLAATAMATALAVVPDGDGLPAGSEVAALVLGD